MKRVLLGFLTLVCLSAAPVAVGAVERQVAPQEDRIADNQPSIKVDRDVIELRNPGSEPLKFEIFSITGQLIKTLTVKSAPVKIELPKGFYIVKCENWTKRVMLK